MAETCIFCEAEVDETCPPEHWIPKWVSRAVVGPTQVVEHHLTWQDEPWHAPIFDVTIPRVCQTCNNHWMSNIETRVSKIALPLIVGDDKRSLSKDEQQRIAVWAFLKAITSEIPRPHDQAQTYPEGLYPVFKEVRRPPHACAILLGGRELDTTAPVLPYAWCRSEGKTYPHPEYGQVSGYRTAFSIGHLVLDVLGLLASVPMTLQHEDDRLVRIWPVESVVEVPTKRFRSTDEI